MCLVRVQQRTKLGKQQQMHAKIDGRPANSEKSIQDSSPRASETSVKNVKDIYELDMFRCHWPTIGIMDTVVSLHISFGPWWKTHSFRPFWARGASCRFNWSFGCCCVWPALGFLIQWQRRISHNQLRYFRQVVAFKYIPVSQSWCKDGIQMTIVQRQTKTDIQMSVTITQD